MTNHRLSPRHDKRCNKLLEPDLVPNPNTRWTVLIDVLARLDTPEGTPVVGALVDGHRRVAQPTSDHVVPSLKQIVIVLECEDGCFGAYHQAEAKTNLTS